MVAEAPFREPGPQRRNFDDLDQFVEAYWHENTPSGGFESAPWAPRRNMRVLTVVTTIGVPGSSNSSIVIFKNGTGFKTITMGSGVGLLVTKIDPGEALKKDTDILQWGLATLGSGATGFGIQVRGR